MKKFFVFFLALSLPASFALAEDEGLGLSFGLEFGVGNMNKANSEDRNPRLTPRIIYQNSFLDDALELYTELDYTFGYNKVPNDDGDEVYPQSLYFDFMLGYNLLDPKSASALSIILENEFDEFIISPRLKETNRVTGVFTPALKFSQEFDAGVLYTQAGVPITYIQYDKDADTEAGFSFILGWESTFGLCMEVKTVIPKKINDTGVVITPEIAYDLQDFTFYVKCEFAGIGADEEDVSISPALGVKYRF